MTENATSIPNVIKKMEHDSGYTMIPNSILQDNSMSGEAKAILFQLYSRPQNWVVRKSQLVSDKCGITKLNRIFKELQEYGYIKGVFVREKGRIVEKVWKVAIEPLFLAGLEEKNRDNGSEKLLIGNLIAEDLIAEDLIAEDLIAEDLFAEDQALQIKIKTNKEKNINKDIKKGHGFETDSLEYLLSEYLLESIQEIKPGFQKNRLKKEGGHEDLLQKWSYDFKLILSKDKIEYDRLSSALVYINQTDQWRPHVLSPAKIRERFDEIETSMLADGFMVEECSKLCKELIKSYGRRILGSRDFKPMNGQMKKFMLGVEKLEEFCKKNRIIKKNMIDYLLSALKDYWTKRGDPVQVGCICSQFTWEQLVPQYIKQLGL